jgi:hypothetical protein
MKSVDETGERHRCAGKDEKALEARWNYPIAQYVYIN